MSLCDITSGYTLGCRDSMGGVHYFIFIQKEHVESVTESDGEATAIALESGERGWKIEQEEETSTANENPIGNRENGTYRVEQEAIVVLNDSQKETRNLVNLLAKNRLVVIAAKNDGTFVLLGKERGLMLGDGTGGSGTAKEDRSGFESLPFTGTERELAPVVDPTIIDGLLVPAS